MAYIPHDARWFLAELVEEIRVEGDECNITHRNLILIRADSPERAYAKALSLGRESECSYQNPYNKQVQITFRGLADLTVGPDELEDGSEILFEKRVGVPEEQIQQWVLPKDQLAVFRETRPSAGPNYSSKEIMEDVTRMIEKGNQ
jgi:hypothetical protein